MKVKIDIDFDDSGDEDVCFQGLTLEAETRAGMDCPALEVALEEITTLLYHMAGAARDE